MTSQTLANGNEAADVQNIFGALAEGLALFRAEVEGEAGRRIAAMGLDDEAIPTMVRTVLEGIDRVLVWLYGAIDAIDEGLISADAALALVETGSAALRSLADGLRFGDIPARYNLPEEPFVVVADAVDVGASLLDTADIIGRVAPSPEDAQAIRRELQALLGTHVDPGLSVDGVPVQGSYVELLIEIGAIAPPAPPAI